MSINPNRFWTKVDEVDRGEEPKRHKTAPLEIILEETNYSDTIEALNQMETQLAVLKINSVNPAAVLAVNDALLDYKKALEDLRVLSEITLRK